MLHRYAQRFCSWVAYKSNSWLCVLVRARRLVKPITNNFLHRKQSDCEKWTRTAGEIEAKIRNGRTRAGNPEMRIQNRTTGEIFGREKCGHLEAIKRKITFATNPIARIMNVQPLPVENSIDLNSTKEKVENSINLRRTKEISKIYNPFQCQCLRKYFKSMMTPS